ncbi:hypothetical protein ACQ4PT_058511 [Festuca glaucescens]
MENVEELMQNLQLSEEERCGVKLRGGGAGSKKTNELQAVGKVLSVKPANANGLEQTLGWLWCPMNGVECKALGNNHFPFNFSHPSGKIKALEDGPWMYGKDLLVMRELEIEKTVDEMDFSVIPIWCRVSKIPPRRMNKENAEAIGSQVGEVIQVDVDEHGSAVGEFLRIKVRIAIKNPLMRAVTIEVEEIEEGIEKRKLRLCLVAYEHLPDFCFNFGLLGHIDRDCSVRLNVGQRQPYGKWMKVEQVKRRYGDEERSRSSGNKGSFWRHLDSGSGGGSKSVSDSLSWRKEDKKDEKQDTCPLKLLQGRTSMLNQKKLSCFEDTIDGERKQENPLKELLSEGTTNEGKPEMNGGVTETEKKQLQMSELKET